MITADYASRFLTEKFGDEIKSVEYIESNLCVNNKVAFPILVSSFYDVTSPVQIFDLENNILGEIAFTKSSNDGEIQGLPLSKCICLIQDHVADEITETKYSFNYDYILINKDYVAEYKTKYKATSAIWGGYFHIEDLPNNNFTKSKIVTKAVAVPNIIANRSLYFETLEMAFKESNPFLRFLKLYHLLELKFDIHTAEKIRDYLGQPNKELEIGRLLRDYNREDIARLDSLFLMNVDSIKIQPLLENIKNFRGTAEKIFYDFGKDSNPLKSRSDFATILSLGTFSEANLTRFLQGRGFDVFLKKLTSYWVYRIRCCIAHNKLGEYPMSINDEEFIVEFAEPLINELIIHCYKQ